MILSSCNAPYNTENETTEGLSGSDTPSDTSESVSESGIPDVSTLEKNNLLRYRDEVKAGDWSEALKKALAENDEVYIPAGEYNVSKVTLTSGKTIRGDGEATVIRALGANMFDLYGKAVS